MHVDVVGVLVKPSCIAAESIKSLNRYLQPRVIHLITPSAASCSILEALAANVLCHAEDDIIPGVTKEKVEQHLQMHLGLNISNMYRGRSPGGWYFQQLLKLGSALHVAGLTEYYLVWDMDMILLRPPRLLATSPEGIKVVVNIGGAMAEGYRSSFRNLFDREVEIASDGSSFVTHQMVVHKPDLLQFLSALSHGGNSTDSWVWKILGAVDPSSADLGFSEYATYQSWVKQNLPGSQHFQRSRTWVRYPFGQGAVRAMAQLRRDRCCCPSGVLLTVMWLLGYEYVGYEVGHIAGCHYNDPHWQGSYCMG